MHECQNYRPTTLRLGVGELVQELSNSRIIIMNARIIRSENYCGRFTARAAGISHRAGNLLPPWPPLVAPLLLNTIGVRLSVGSTAARRDATRDSIIFPFNARPPAASMIRLINTRDPSNRGSYWIGRFPSSGCGPGSASDVHRSLSRTLHVCAYVYTCMYVNVCM